MSMVASWSRRRIRTTPSCGSGVKPGTSGNPAGGWNPQERLTLDEALRGYTLEAAYAEFEENAKGSIEKGKLADLTVIGQDITKIPPPAILSIQVLKTFVGGKVVYDAATAH